MSCTNSYKLSTVSHKFRFSFLYLSSSLQWYFMCMNYTNIKKLPLQASKPICSFNLFDIHFSKIRQVETHNFLMWWQKFEVILKFYSTLLNFSLYCILFSNSTVFIFLFQFFINLSVGTPKLNSISEHISWSSKSCIVICTRVVPFGVL